MDLEIIRDVKINATSGKRYIGIGFCASIPGSSRNIPIRRCTCISALVQVSPKQFSPVLPAREVHRYFIALVSTVRPSCIGVNRPR